MGFTIITTAVKFVLLAFIARTQFRRLAQADNTRMQSSKRPGASLANVATSPTESKPSARPVSLAISQTRPERVCALHVLPEPTSCLPVSSSVKIAKLDFTVLAQPPHKFHVQLDTARSCRPRLSANLAILALTLTSLRRKLANHAKTEPFLFPQNRRLATYALPDTHAMKTINALPLVLKKLPTKEIKEYALSAKNAKL